jgi:hypothetical protein
MTEKVPCPTCGGLDTVMLFLSVACNTCDPPKKVKNGGVYPTNPKRTSPDWALYASSYACNKNEVLSERYQRGKTLDWILGACSVLGLRWYGIKPEAQVKRKSRSGSNHYYDIKDTVYLGTEINGVLTP